MLPLFWPEVWTSRFTEESGMVMAKHVLSWGYLFTSYNKDLSLALLEFLCNLDFKAFARRQVQKAIEETSAVLYTLKHPRTSR